MARPKEQSAQAQIVAAARKHFGQDVARVSAPGGENRSSFRLHLTDRTVIKDIVQQRMIEITKGAAP